MRLGWIVCLTTPNAVLLSTWIGVGGWGCPISINRCCIGTSSRALIYRAPNFASAADIITALMIWNTVSTEPLLAGKRSSLEQKKWPPALLCAFVYAVLL